MTYGKEVSTIVPEYSAIRLRHLVTLETKKEGFDSPT